MTRLVLAPCLFAFNWLIYTLVFQILEENMNQSDEVALLLTDCIMAPIFAVAWIAVWVSVIKWNAGRLLGTAVGFVIACILGVGYFHAMAWSGSFNDEFNYVLAYMFWMASWITATALLWRTTTRERAIMRADTYAGIVLCPNCRYNLKGLRQTKCPECGSDYTLDELLAAAAIDNGGTSGLH
jgi:ssDNA-binding Zn-finger/Zn-ribbon topoisomerase 1